MREDSEPGAFALSVATLSENFFTNDDHDRASRLVKITPASPWRKDDVDASRAER
jgi:hypothetical protein